MKKYKGKELMNTLLNIDNIFGEYEGKLLPLIIVLLLGGAPILVWVFFLQGTNISIWWVVGLDVPWTAVWAINIFGNYKEKKHFYLEQRQDKGATADTIIHVKNITEEGLIQFDTGGVALIVSGYLKSYLTEDKLSVDLENFMNQLDTWNWDYYLHTAIDELKCEDELPKLRRYTDPDVIRERIGFYAYQDEWASTHAGLYRITFVVSDSSYNWKKLISGVKDLISSEAAKCFNEVSILEYDDVVDILGRDVAAYIDIRSMLRTKFDNSDYHGSSVMWYDDKIPEDFIIEEEESDLEGRRL